MGRLRLGSCFAGWEAGDKAAAKMLPAFRCCTTGVVSAHAERLCAGE